VTGSPLANAYIPGWSGHTQGPVGTVTRIVIHGTVSPCQDGGARGNASYFQDPNSGGLAHYIVDPSEIVQTCDEDLACWHAPPNANSLGVEFCDPQQGDPARWQDGPHQQMLALGARLVADLCARHGIPVTHIDAGGLLNGQRGIPGHVDVSQAWHQSDHTDPGPDFPWQQFLALVAGPAAPPKPQPAPPPAGPVHRPPAPIPPAVPGGFDVTGLPLLRQGSKGQPVRNLQGLLLAAARPVTVDGDFGPGTDRALRQWQAAAGLTSDGIAGNRTWGYLLGARVG